LFTDSPHHRRFGVDSARWKEAGMWEGLQLGFWIRLP
jgi:hypothetical protein